MLKLLWLWMGYMDKIYEVTPSTGILAQIELAGHSTIVMGTTLGDENENLKDMFLRPNHWLPTERPADSTPFYIEGPFGRKIPTYMRPFRPNEVTDWTIQAAKNHDEEEIKWRSDKMVEKVKYTMAHITCYWIRGQQDTFERQEELFTEENDY